MDIWRKVAKVDFKLLELPIDKIVILPKKKITAH